MRKDVIITICGKPRYDIDGESDNIELMTEGKLYKKNGKYYIIYKESSLTGLAGVTTTLKVEDSCVTLIRSGLMSTQMIFEEGKKHFGLYQTDEGTLTVSVSASRVKSRIGDNGGDLFIDYSVEIDNMLTAENSLSLTIS